MRISDWSSDVCSSDLHGRGVRQRLRFTQGVHRRAQSEFEKPGLGTAQQSFAHGIDDRCRVVEIQDPQPERFRSEEHTSELQSLMRISYAVFCLKKKNTINTKEHNNKTSQQQQQRTDT